MTRSTDGGAPPPRRRRAGRLVSLSTVLTLGLAAPLMPAAAEPTESLAFVVVDPRITTSSGLARDTDNDVFWTVNAANREGIAYALSPDGRTKGTLEFAAEPVDAEAVAYVDGTLYVADIGDNDRSRPTVRVFAFPNATPGQQRGTNFQTYEFVYPGGPQDAEGLLVDAEGRIRIVTKAESGAVYRAPFPLAGPGPHELIRVADAPPFVTDATVLPSGRHALRTYVGVHIQNPETYAPVSVAELPYQPQGESMALSMTDTALIMGSVGEQQRVLRVPIPTELTEVPEGVASPPPSPSPSPEPEPIDVGGEIRTNRTGTYVALALAAAVAVLAGAIVFLRDRRKPGDETPVSARREWSDEPSDEADESVSTSAAAEAEGAQVPAAADPEGTRGPADGDESSAREDGPDNR